MQINIDDGWRPKELKVGSVVVRAFHRNATGNVDVDHPFIEERLPWVAAEGGVLVRHRHEWTMIPAPAVNPGVPAGYTLAPARADFWYIPRCSFEESLGLLETFGFPSSSVCNAPEEVRRLAQALILELAKQRKLVWMTIAPDIVDIQRLEGPDFTTEEMTRLLAFNQAHFGITYSKAEFLDLRRWYRRNGFCILGRM